MPVWVRRSLIVLVALVLVLAAAAAWFASQFDANRYKSVAVEWMKTQRNRTLAIDGPIRLSVFPRLEVRLSKIRLSEVGSMHQFASLEEAALAVDLLPLLRGELVVGRIEARGVEAALQRDAKGRRNTDDLVQGGATDSASGRTLGFDVRRIELADLRARVKDELAGIDGELLLKELSSGRIASGVESSVKLDAQFGFKAPALRGELSGRAKVTPDFSTRSLRLDDLALGYKGDAPGASGIDATLKGALAWDGAEGAFDAKALELRATATVAGVKLNESTLAVDRFAFDPSRKTFAVAKLRLRLKGSRSAQPLELDLDWPELDVSGNALRGSALTGRFSLAGEWPLAATFKSGAPAGSFDNVRVPGFEARLISEGGARKIDGVLRSELRLQPGQGTLSLNALELQTRVDEPGLKSLALNLRGNAEASARAAQWSLAGQLNTTACNIDGSANFTATTPSVKAQLRFDALDLNAVLPPAKGAPGAPTPAQTAVDLSALRSINGSFGLRAGSLAFRQYRIGDARVDATLDAGMLRVSTLQGKVWGGTVDASAFADARASRVALKGTASGVNVNALLKDVAAKDLLEGNGRVNLDVESAGRSIGELRSRLKGNAALQLRDGSIKGINLAKSLRQAKAAITLKKDAAQKANQTEKTDFSELNASFQIDGGVARNRDLDVKSPYLRLGGDGALDVGKGRIDYTVRAAVTDTSKGQDGAELAALKGLTVPVQLTGPFEAIDWKIQWSAVAAGAVRSQVEDKLKERLGLKAPAAGASGPSAQDKLKDKLKGLFK